MSKPGKKQISVKWDEAALREFDRHVKRAKSNKTAVLGGMIEDYNLERRADEARSKP